MINTILEAVLIFSLSNAPVEFRPHCDELPGALSCTQQYEEDLETYLNEQCPDGDTCIWPDYVVNKGSTIEYFSYDSQRKFIRCNGNNCGPIYPGMNYIDPTQSLSRFKHLGN